MKKNYAQLLVLSPLVMLTMVLSGCSFFSTKKMSSSDSSYTDKVVSSVENDDDQFNDTDIKDVTDGDYDAVITLSGNSGTISNTDYGSSGTTVTITAKGVFYVSGSSQNVQIKVSDSAKSGNVYLVFDNVTMTHSTNACVLVESADKVIIQCVNSNAITSTYTSGISASYNGNSYTIDGAIHARDDLTINGSGDLTVTSQANGVVCKNDLKITGSTLTINASNGKGIDAKSSVRIGGGSTTITAKEDGIRVESQDIAEGSVTTEQLQLFKRFYMESGFLTITASQDGISATADDEVSNAVPGIIYISGGTINIKTGRGSTYTKTSSISQKGIKCASNIQIGNATITVDSQDDAIHSNASTSITAGTYQLASGDDGIHSDVTTSLSGGKVTVTKSYEGLEGYYVELSGGEHSITASDDGINAGGGSDSDDNDDGFGPGGGGGHGHFNLASDTTAPLLSISGGTNYIFAQGDGLDSNGNIEVSGGTTIVEGPSNGGNGAIDKGDGGSYYAKITGGTVLALGSTGMAVNFNSGTQCSGLVKLSGSQNTVVSVEDGSGFTHTFKSNKSFACAVYSSPSMSKGNKYTIKAGSSSATMDFSSSLYYSNVRGGGPGGW